MLFLPLLSQWFANGFWDEVKGDMHQIWTWAQAFGELDKLTTNRKGLHYSVQRSTD